MRRIPPNLLLVGFMLGGSAFPLASLAQVPCNTAEYNQLSQEMSSLATRNFWTGVERAYVKLEQLDGCELSFQHHQLGAEAARFVGKTSEMVQRLRRGHELEPAAGLDSAITATEDNYGQVYIQGKQQRPPKLVREAMPFSPDQRKSIERATEVLANTGQFDGLLPSGDYVAGGVAFSIQPGSPVEVDARRANADETIGGHRPIRYHGPVAQLGPSFITSPEPSKAVVWGGPNPDQLHEHQPESFTASGISLLAGYELGFTDHVGLAATANYLGILGTHSLHNVRGSLVVSVRPGNFRLTAGPTYGLLGGTGRGLATWFDRGFDSREYPNQQIGYEGFSYGPGAEAALGYGVTRLRTLNGLVEIHGAVQFDNTRAYYTYGVRFGVMPHIDRFKS
ncbi:MAG: hypothetical protein HN348_22325 [Proteobacteria bacterium]|nr:hypothetical protein [Pseudomonadota bacterium]